jgi:hypothetical protein
MTTNLFVHNFPSCSRTYATLCIYHKSKDPREVTEALAIAPDKSHRAGEVLGLGKPTPSSGWFLGTKGIVKSKDLRAHIDWLLKKISPRKSKLFSLLDEGYEMKISCFWVSAVGNGGPYIDHGMLQALSEYPVDLDFDIWFSEPRATTNKPS